MIRLNWEETGLVILFSSIVGASIVQGHWGALAGAALFVAALVASGARNPPTPGAT